MAYKTEQEEFWAKEFGDDYVDRNRDFLAKKTHFFSEILSNFTQFNSLIELGSNIGLNLDALQALLPNLELKGLEINEKAFNELKIKHPLSEHGSIFDFKPERKFDVSMTMGVMIHINPEYLEKVYEALWESSNRYILIGEYYNPTPVEVKYRGHEGRLFKRDFAGEMMDKYPLELRAYGFRYHRDPLFPLDDSTWFLLEKNK
jgi:spore coat polysaccharide biosynthesis protein SpsF